MNRFTLLTTIILLISGIPLKGISQELNSKNNLDEWTIVAAFEIPGQASGLAWDGQFLYSGIYGVDGDHIYKIDPTNGDYELLFVSPAMEDCYGLTHDGEKLWTVVQGDGSSDPSIATQLNNDGSSSETIVLPNHYMSGIAYDNGDFWVATYYEDPGTIHKIDDQGNVLAEFTPPADQPWDLCVHGDDLWIADYYADMLYKVDQNGNVLESHNSEQDQPAGVVWDGQYLWYVDGPSGAPSTLYKISFSGAGTPQINITQDEHDFGTVVVNTNESWTLNVSNNGSADLVISDVEFDANANLFSINNSLPVTITPGNSQNIDFEFTPTEIGAVSTQATLISNDPISPEVEINLAGYGVAEYPTALLTSDELDYGDVRINAFTRQFIEIQNLGNDVLQIHEVIPEHNSFIIEESNSLPIEIETLEVKRIGVWFNPTMAIEYPWSIQLTTNMSDDPFIFINVNGSGDPSMIDIGEELWSTTIQGGYDNTPKGICAIPDITGDGKDEVIVSSEDGFMRCMNGNAHNHADVIWEVEVASVYTNHGLDVIKDIDGDGFHDVIIGTIWGDKSIRAFSGKNGEQIWVRNTNEYGDGAWVYQVDAKQDFNEDGIIDVVACTGDDGDGTGPRRIYCLSGEDGSSIWENQIGDGLYSAISVEDFTGDGVADVIGGGTKNGQSDGFVVGINGVTNQVYFEVETEGSSVWALAQLDDLNNDGIKEIAAGDYNGSILIIDPSNGNVIDENLIAGSYNPIYHLDPVPDVNGDGFVDLAVGHTETVALLVNGENAELIWSKPIADKSWNALSVGDVSGDDIADIAIGTLFENNKVYFFSGADGEILETVDVGSPIDALGVIGDVANDLSNEVMVGGRNGHLICLSGGYENVDNVLQVKERNIINAFPNPCHEYVSIELPENSCDVQIFNHTGHLVFRKSFSNNTKNQILNWDLRNDSGEQVSPGVYMVMIDSRGGSFKGKIIVL